MAAEDLAPEYAPTKGQEAGGGFGEFRGGGGARGWGGGGGGGIPSAGEVGFFFFLFSGYPFWVWVKREAKKTGTYFETTPCVGVSLGPSRLGLLPHPRITWSLKEGAL